VRRKSLGDVINDKFITTLYTDRKEVWRLKQFECHPVFIYGQEQKGMTQHKLLRNSPRVGVGMTSTGCFTLNVSKEYGYPVAIAEDEADVSAKLFGEVYLMSPDDIMELDRHYQTGINFRRLRRGIHHYDPAVPQDKRITRVTLCHMYLGETNIWLKRRADEEVFLSEIHEIPAPSV
jgi:hypothetical protein